MANYSDICVAIRDTLGSKFPDLPNLGGKRSDIALPIPRPKLISNLHLQGIDLDLFGHLSPEIGYRGVTEETLRYDFEAFVLLFFVIESQENIGAWLRSRISLNNWAMNRVFPLRGCIRDRYWFLGTLIWLLGNANNSLIVDAFDLLAGIDGKEIGVKDSTLISPNLPNPMPLRDCNWEYFLAGTPPGVPSESRIVWWNRLYEICEAHEQHEALTQAMQLLHYGSASHARLLEFFYSEPADKGYVDRDRKRFTTADRKQLYQLQLDIFSMDYPAARLKQVLVPKHLNYRTFKDLFHMIGEDEMCPDVSAIEQALFVLLKTFNMKSRL